MIEFKIDDWTQHHVKVNISYSSILKTDQIIQKSEKQFKREPLQYHQASWVIRADVLWWNPRQRQLILLFFLSAELFIFRLNLRCFHMRGNFFYWFQMKSFILIKLWQTIRLYQWQKVKFHLFWYVRITRQATSPKAFESLSFNWKMCVEQLFKYI